MTTIITMVLLRLWLLGSVCSWSNISTCRLACEGLMNLVTSLCHICLCTGARVDIKDRQGNTSLHIAARHGHASVTKTLICNGAAQQICAEGLGEYCPCTWRASVATPTAWSCSYPEVSGRVGDGCGLVLGGMGVD